jgi:general secretion pathway protein D
MDIRQKVESYDGDVEIANVGKVPITSQKEANAKVAVRDGDTIMLGGLISNEKTKSNSGVPILKDIPLLGALFRQTSSSDNQRELIVLIRPTVLPSPQDAAAQAIKEQRKLPAVRAAERDYWRDQNRRLEDQDRQDDRDSESVLKKEGLPK